MLRHLAKSALSLALVMVSATHAISSEPAAKWAEAFIAKDFTSLWASMTPELREAAGSHADFRTFRKNIEQAYGHEKSVISQKLQRQDGGTVYSRISDWSESDVHLSITVVVEDTGTVSGFLVQPLAKPAESPFLDYQTQTHLRLPFDDEWVVYWGGRTVEENYHAAHPIQRFATDFVVSRNGTTHSGPGNTPEDYHCWNLPILAPAAGTVIAFKDGLPDQAIGSSDPRNPAGNHIVLDFGNGEFGFLAHLKKGSIEVFDGDKVRSGQRIGRCGNSGNSSEPHLHFHLQTTGDLNDGAGLPAQFNDYRADGAPVERGEPKQGQVLLPGQ